VRLPSGLLARGIAVSLPASVVPTVVVLASRGSVWAGEWAWSIDWANGVVVLSGPLAAGLAAFEVARCSGPDVRLVQRQSVRPRSLVIVVVATVFSCALAGWLLAIGYVSFVNLRLHAEGPIPWRPTIVIPVQLLFCVTFGAALGSFLRPAVGAPVASLAIFALSYLGGTGALPNLLRNGGSTGSLTGMTWDPGYMRTTIVVLALGTALATLFVTQPTSVMRKGVSAVCAGLVLVLLMFLALASNPSTERLAISDEPVPMTCKGSLVSTCLARANATHIGELAARVDTYAAVLKKVGADVPHRFVQEVPGRKPDISSGLMAIPSAYKNRAGADPAAVADYVVMPRPCPAYFGPEAPSGALESAALVAHWLRVELELVPPPPPGDAMGDWFAGDLSAQRAWVAQTYTQLRACDLGSAQLPFP